MLSSAEGCFTAESNSCAHGSSEHTSAHGGSNPFSSPRAPRVEPVSSPPCIAVSLSVTCLTCICTAPHVSPPSLTLCEPWPLRELTELFIRKNVCKAVCLSHAICVNSWGWGQKQLRTRGPRGEGSDLPSRVTAQRRDVCVMPACPSLIPSPLSSLPLISYFLNSPPPTPASLGERLWHS